jgi:CRISP-associated protein Cas1
LRLHCQTRNIITSGPDALATVAAGLHTTVGIEHSNRCNAFALADDLVEPFRSIVDALVAVMFDEGIESFSPVAKRRIARLFVFDVRMGDEASPVSVAAQHLAQSLAKCFEESRAELALFTPPLPIERSSIGCAVDDDA